MSPTRRDLLKAAATGALGLTLAPTLSAQTPPPAQPRPAGPMPEGVGRAARPLRILILGGTGFIGPHEVRYALARGHKLTLFNRGRNPLMWPGEVEELTGDRNTGDLDSLKGREWDVCIDNPTMLPFWVRDAGQVLKGKVGQYVFISTLSVSASDAPVGLDESMPVAKYTGADPMKETMETLRAKMGDLYGPLKAICEKEAEVWFPGITTVIRPTLIVGPGDPSDRFTYWPVRLDRGGDVLAPGDGSDFTQLVDARDLAAWIVHTTETRALGIYNAAGPAFELTMLAMLYGARAATTVGATLHWAPVPFLEAHKVRAWSDMPTWVPTTPETAGFSRYSAKKAIAAGLTFRPLAATALDTIAWFKTLPAARQAKMHAGLAPDRERELLAALRGA